MTDRAVGCSGETNCIIRDKPMPSTAVTEYRRFHSPGATWFFTVNLAERKGNRLLVNRIEVLRAAFVTVRAKHPFRIDAITVLPDHLHCILTLPVGDTTIPLTGV